MKRWLLHNLGLKILSLALAAVVWWLIDTKINRWSAQAPFPENRSGPVTFP